MKEQLSGSKDMKFRVHFNLKQMREEDKLTQIMLVTTVNRQRIRVYTKLRIEPKYWDKHNYRCKTEPIMSVRDRTRLNQINHRLNKLVTSIHQTDAKLAEQGKYLSQAAIRTVIEERNATTNQTTTPVAYLYQQVDEYLRSLNRRGKRGISSTQRTYLTALKRLENFCISQKLSPRSFDDFDKKFFTDFAHYLYSYIGVR